MNRRNLIAVGEAAFGEQWQTEISEYLGVSTRTIRNWVSGKHKIPPLERELIEMLKRRISQIEKQITVLTKEMKMTKSINDFLTDTESFHSSVIFKPASADTDKASLYNRISMKVEDIARQIGDIKYGNVVSVQIDEQLVLTLGTLGSYYIDTTPENLAVVCNRLTYLSSSARFIRLMSE